MAVSVTTKRRQESDSRPTDIPQLPGEDRTAPKGLCRPKWMTGSLRPSSPGGKARGWRAGRPSNWCRAGEQRIKVQRCTLIGVIGWLPAAGGEDGRLEG